MVVGLGTVDRHGGSMGVVAVMVALGEQWRLLIWGILGVAFVGVA